MKMQTCSFSDKDITTQIFLVTWKSIANNATAHYNLFGYLYTLVCPSEVDTEFHIQWHETAVGVTVESNCPPGRTGKYY